MKQIISTADQVGHILSSRRKALKLSQKDLASKLGIVQSRISNLEEDASRLMLDRLIALVNLLDLEIVLQNKSNNQTQKSEW